MSTQPLVSFIIPYFNAGSTIQETIDSVFSQSYENYDIWIIDDGSTDKASVEKLKTFEGIEKIHILHQQNTGPGIARNIAIQQTNAKFIVPLDADDAISVNAVAKAMLLMFQDDKNGVVYGNIEYFGEKKGIKIQKPFDLQRQFFMNQIAVTCLIKKAVFETAGYYDEFLSKPGLEDWEFWIRVGQTNWDLIKTEEIFFKVRVQQSSRTYLVANKNLDKIKEYIFTKHALVIGKILEDLYYQKKQLLETPDYKIGNFLLRPYRFFKYKLLK
jgi:glycosyltransferase involved in cell wall biosynthesis